MPHSLCLAFNKKLQGMRKGKKQFEEPEQVSELWCGMDVGIYQTWKLKQMC
jgi:hypothetical protein